MKHTLLLGASPVPLVSRPSSLCVTHLIGVAFKSCTEMPFLTVGCVGRKQVKKRGKELKGSNVMEVSLVLDYRGDNAYIGIAWDGIGLH